MRAAVRRVALVLTALAPACSPASTPIEPPVVSGVVTNSTATSVVAATTTTEPEAVETLAGETAGTLPDGTNYQVMVEPALSSPIDGISGAVMIDLDDGSSWVLGVTTFGLRDTGTQPIQFTGNRFAVASAGGRVTISLTDEALTLLEPDPERALRAGVKAAEGAVLPALELHPPFRWATDTELPLQMGVRHGHFEVRRGCNDAVAVACSQTRSVQVIPTELLYSAAPSWPDDAVAWIESTAARPATDPSYLDPGPLTARAGHAVLWTGSEMIVWGGTETDEAPALTDGAAYDPVADTWRMLPAAPLNPGQINRALWAGDRMIVVGSDETAEYHPETDSWRVIASGIEPPLSHRLLVWTGESVVLWNANGLYQLDETAAEWVSFDGPGFGNSDPWETALHSVDGRLAVVALRDGNCSGRRVAVMAASAWDTLPDVSLDTPSHADCSYPHQMTWVGDRLLAWEDDDHPTMALTFGAAWEEVATIPLRGHESPDGAVMMGDRILVPRLGDAALFDSSTAVWSEVTLPGYGNAADMVWTGSEILTWGPPCCYETPGGRSTNDAWRWRPPEPAGG